MLPFTPADLFLHRKITDLHCTPCLDMAALAVQSVDRDEDGYLSHIWLFPLGGEPARQLTHGPGRDQSPRWSPDGRQLAFTSTRAGGAPQAQVMPAGGGEPRQLGDFELGVTQLRWAPDGKSLLACVAVRVDPEARGQRAAATPRAADAPEVCWRLPYKADGIGYILAREIHLFRIDAGSGEATQLTHGPFDVEGFEPSPDGARIAFSRSREGRFAHATDLWLCDADGGGARRVTHGHATVMAPAWSPDGRWIAFAGAVAEGDGQSGLWLLECATGQVGPLGPPGLEVADPRYLCWAGDSRELVLLRATQGRHEIVCLSVPGGRLKTLVAGDRQFGAFGCSGEHLVFSVDAPTQPSELWACARDGAGERRVSDLNGWWRERVPIAMQRRRFDVPDGRGGVEPVHGWLLRAEGSEGPMPLLTDVHGGPASYALLDYDTNVYWHSLCSRGWAVLLLNPVGSSSFGREFCERLSGRWGELDLPQHLAALRQLREEGLCDERLAIAGKSYGGFLTAWAIGHCDTFRAAVVMAPVGNIETHYGTSDGGYYADPLYLGSQPRFDRGLARRLSPLQYVERAVTPTLFMQGKDDERCPRCQSEELFVSLYRAGEAAAEMVLYPGETHHFLDQGKPSNRADAARRIVDWVTRYSGRPLPRRRSEDRMAGQEQHESTSG